MIIHFIISYENDRTKAQAGMYDTVQQLPAKQKQKAY